MRNVSILVLATAAVAAHAAPFTGSVLGIDNSSIYSIDLASGLATSLVSIAGRGTGEANGLAYDYTKNVAYFQRNGDLWSVDLGSNAFAKIGATVGSTAGATYYKGAYVYGTSTSIKSLDLTSKAVSTVGTYNKGWGFGDVATKGDTLYGVAGKSLFTIDMATTAYGQIAATAKQTQIAFVGSALYGIANGNAGDPAGTIYSIDTATGAFVAGPNRVHNASGAFLAINDAATVNPVPEPASLAALGLGALGVLRRRRNRA